MANLKYVSFHGFNVSDGGASTVGKLDEFLDTIPVKYGWMWRVRVRLCNKSIAETVASLVSGKCIAVAHSNGALIAVQAVEAGAKFDKLVLINPALDVNYKFPEGQRVDVYHTPEDRATLLARFIPLSDWGAMGRYGYKGNNPLVHNYNSEKLFGSKKHSDVFDSAEDLALHIKSGNT